MLRRGHYYPEQIHPAEPTVLFIRRHWFAFSSWAILTTVMLLTPILFLSVLISVIPFDELSETARTVLVLGLSAYYLFTLAVFLAAWIDYYFDLTIVTEQRLIDIHQNGLFNHRISEQPLRQVQDVSVRIKGPVQTFFQFGTVYVETAGEAPNFVMQNMPNPHRAANTIVELHNRLLNQHYESPERRAAEEPPKPLTAPNVR